MNLLLLEEADFIAADRVVLRDRRLTHMQEVHRSEVGDSLRVGRIGGLMGNAKLLRLESGEAELQISLDQSVIPGSKISDRVASTPNVFADVDLSIREGDFVDNVGKMVRHRSKHMLEPARQFGLALDQM